MTKLSDLQRILLANAAHQPAGTLLPIPVSVSAPKVRTDAALRALLKRGLVSEAPALNTDSSWREDGDAGLTLVITEAEHTAIGTAAASEYLEASKQLVTANPSPADQPKRSSMRPCSVCSSARTGQRRPS